MRDFERGSTIEIERIIQEVEAISNSATRVPGLRKRVMVDLDRLMGVGEDLRSSIPSDIQEAREVLKQKESIVNQAHLESRRVKESAEQESQEMVAASHQEHQSRVDETEIVKAAEAKAEEINQQALQDAQQIDQDAQRRSYRTLEEAEATAGSRREGADQYARETLFELEERLSVLLGQVRRGIDALGLDVEARTPERMATIAKAVEEAAVS